MKILNFFIILSIILTSCNKKNDLILYKIIENGQYGFIDSTGQIVIECNFDYASDYIDQYTLVIQDTLYGYIDASGKEVIPIQQSLRNFAIKEKSNHSDYGNLYDQLSAHLTNKVDSLFDYSVFDKLNFSNGLAIYVNENGLSGYKNYKFNTAVKEQFGRANPYSDSLAIVTLPIDNTKDILYNEKLTGVIDLKGDFIVSPKFFYMSDYINGYSTAMIKDYSFNDNGTVDIMNYRAFLMDKKGNISYSFPSSVHFSGPKVGDFVLTNNLFMGSFTYIDLYDKYNYNIVGQWFEDAKNPIKIDDFDGTTLNGIIDSNLVNNYYLFPLKISINNKWGLYPLEGGFKSQNWLDEFFMYDDMLQAREGVIAVKKDGLWGFINFKNEIVIPIKYTKVSSFKNGLAYVEEKQLSSILKSYIDKTGKYIYSSLETKI